MKKLSKWISSAAAGLLLLAACGGGDETGTAPRVAVGGVAIDPPTLELNEGEFQTLTATITPSDATDQKLHWISSNTKVATVENGTVTAVSKGTATVTATTADGGYQATCAVTVTRGEHPVFGTVGFRTDKIWIVGAQMWSDVVMGSRCKKDDFDGGESSSKYGENVEYKVDCRQNEGHGDMFSWEAVAQYKAVLCPDGWRVPTAEDFQTLDKVLNNRSDANGRGNDVASIKRYEDPELWGGEYSGLARAGEINNKGRAAYYWSQTISSSYGVMLDFYHEVNSIDPNDLGERDFGFTVLCVKE